MSKRDETFPVAPFEGFPLQAMAFLRTLDKNQTREWFAANKPDYERFVRGPLQSLVADVSARLAKAKVPLHGDPKRSLFRINRDVRFSKDKRPYNSHASAALTRDGDKHSQGVLYIHIDPSGSFAAVGFFRPEPAILQALRARLVAERDAWGKVERALAKADLRLSSDDTLVRLPRGFEATSERNDHLLKLKSWLVRRDLTAADIATPSLVDDIVSLSSNASPLLRFGWDAMS
jgi:uncharacterized protein (TIGR02453 family)